MDVSKYIAIPFANRGRTFAGCDCYGLIRLILKDEYGVDWPLLLDYEESNGDNSKLFSTNIPLLSGSKVDVPKEGDIGVFKFRGVPSHIGMYIGSNMVIHVMSGIDSTCERLNSVRLKGRLDGWYRVS